MHPLLQTPFLFLALAHAATVYLYPSDSLPSLSTLSTSDAHLVLATHLRLDQFDLVDQRPGIDHLNLFGERPFVGRGDENGLVILLDEEYARDVLPSALTPSFSFSESPTGLEVLIGTYTRRAAQVYTHVPPSSPTHGFPRILDIFSAPTLANEVFLSQASTLLEFVDAGLPGDGNGNRFAALEMTAIKDLAETYGRTSDAYGVATELIKAAVEKAMEDGTRVAVVSYAPTAPGTHRKSRVLAVQSGEAEDVGVGETSVLEPTQAQAQGQAQIHASSSCYTSYFDCADATEDCSGHGQCTNATRAGQACFVCACSSTVKDGRTQYWAGERCERRDVSGPFVLITGTVITLVLLVGGSITLLYAINEQALPSILTGGVAGGVRKE